METERLDPEKIKKMLGKGLFSENIVFYERIPSTNLIAKELALGGAPDRTVVLTEEQTAGRGRKERPWLSPGHRNLLVSILLRPDLSADKVFVLTMVLAIAVIDGIKKTAGIDAMIKWPNDIYIGNKKVGGILTEFSMR